MTTIRFQEDAYHRTAHSLTEAAHALTDCAAKLPVSWGIGQPVLEARLNACRRRVYASADQAKGLSTAVRKAADTLAACEKNLMTREKNDPWLDDVLRHGDMNSIAKAIETWLNNQPGTPPPYPWLTGPMLSTLLAAAVDSDNFGEYVKTLVTDQIIKAGSISDKVSVGGSLYSTGFTNEYGGGNLTVGAYEASASYNAMLFSKNADGSLVLNPTLDVAAGVTFTALSASVSQNVQIVPGLSAGIGGEVTVGKVDASVKASIGLMEPDGSFNPHAKLSANAQATLFEANAHGNVDVLGVNTTVEGGVTVGIGAHADVGYSNGVVSADLGAAVGIGLNLSVSVDVSGVVDTAMDVCECAGDFISWLM